MLVKDSEKVAQHAEMLAAEKERQRTYDWLKDQLRTAVYIDESGNDRTNAGRQLGRALLVGDVEKRLKKLVPRLRFEFTLNPFKKYMFLEMPSGECEKLMLYESGRKGPIPEHSIMQKVIKEDLNPDVVGGTKPFHIDRKDLPRHEVRPHEFDEQGRLKRLGEVIWDETEPIVGMQRRAREWNEAVRGYRTMAAMLVKLGLTTPDAVERAFGGADRPEWAHAMGKREKETPW